MTSFWSARRRTPGRATPSPQPAADCRWWSFDGTVEVVGPDGPVPFLDVFHGRDELVVYKHMWHDGTPHQGQCEGCTTTAWHMKDAVYLNARGISFAILTTGPWREVAPYVEFMGSTQPWYSVRDVKAPVGESMGSITAFLRNGDRTFLTYSTTGRGNEPINGSLGLLDMTPYGRREVWEDNPEGWPEAPEVGAPVGGHGSPISLSWRTDADGVATWRPRPAGPCRSGPAPAPPPWTPLRAIARALQVMGIFMYVVQLLPLGECECLFMVGSEVVQGAIEVRTMALIQDAENDLRAMVGREDALISSW